MKSGVPFLDALFFIQVPFTLRQNGNFFAVDFTCVVALALALNRWRAG